MSGKTIAIIAHITFIGWIVALIINSSERDMMAGFYIRQTLGIFIMLFLGAIPVIGWLVAAAGVLFWILSFVSILSDRIVPVPFMGDKFQDWFRSI